MNKGGIGVAVISPPANFISGKRSTQNIQMAISVHICGEKGTRLWKSGLKFVLCESGVGAAAAFPPMQSAIDSVCCDQVLISVIVQIRRMDSGGGLRIGDVGNVVPLKGDRLGQKAVENGGNQE